MSTLIFDWHGVHYRISVRPGRLIEGCCHTGHTTAAEAVECDPATMGNWDLPGLEADGQQDRSWVASERLSTWILGQLAAQGVAGRQVRTGATG